MLLVLSLNAEAASQKHRHSARTEQVDSTKDKQDAIEAFSDTTSSSKEDAEDDQYITHRHRTTYTTSSDVKELKEVMEGVGGIFGPMLAVGIVAFVVILLLLPQESAPSEHSRGHSSPYSGCWFRHQRRFPHLPSHLAL